MKTQGSHCTSSDSMQRSQNGKESAAIGEKQHSQNGKAFAPSCDKQRSQNGKTFASFGVEQLTLRDDEVSPVFREPGVKTGYRHPNRGWSYYVASLFHMNNETLNIWTHLLGCGVMIYQLCSYAALHGIWSDESRRVVHVFNLCTVIYTFLSTVAHTFHNRSELVHYVCFQADYAGIALNTYCSGLGAFYICSRNETFFRTFESVFLPLNTILAWLSYLGCSFAKVQYTCEHSSRRKVLQIVSVVIHTAVSCSPVFLRYYECFIDETCSLASMNHHTGYLLVLGVSAMFFSSHIPETLAPGWFDFAGQGHQIFHVMVIWFSVLQLSAADIELGLLKDSFQRTFPTWPMLITSLVTVIALDAITMIILSKYVNQKLQKNKKL